MDKRRGWKRRLFLLAITLSIYGGLAYYVTNHVTLEELIVQERIVRDYIASQPWRSFGIGLAFYAVVSLVPGTSGKSVVFGWLFGLWRAFFIIIAGLTAAAMAMFFLSRYIVRDAIERRFGKFLAALNRHLEKEGAFYLLTLRMAHFPYSFINLASGASRVHARTFAWTCALGLVPGTLVFAYVGSRLPSLEELVEKGAGSLIDTPLIVVLVASAAFPFLFRWCARRMGILRASDATDELDVELPAS